MSEQLSGQSGEEWARDLTEVETRAALRIAREFHSTYERLAPEHGYRTRPGSAVPWERVPSANRALMIHTAWDLIARDVITITEGPSRG